MSQPGPILVQPHNGPTIGPNQGNDIPKVLKDLGLVGFVAVEGKSTPESGVSSLPIGLQVDDVELAHKFQV